MSSLRQIKINSYQLFPDVRIKRVTKHPHKMCNFKLCIEFIKSCPSFGVLPNPIKSILIFQYRLILFYFYF